MTDEHVEQINAALTRAAEQGVAGATNEWDLLWAPYDIDAPAVDWQAEVGSGRCARTTWTVEPGVDLDLQVLHTDAGYRLYVRWTADGEDYPGLALIEDLAALAVFVASERERADRRARHAVAHERKPNLWQRWRDLDRT